ncbi:hypothetical protein CEXT_247291 [Caerostris extrusa]|uniref:Uncharacterized protein n=1 Tax=Caerostris extrusa TaxID=172846 RepID=A0AAV4ME99_CAEEX|nr:hypothetical protein CEXT_247291 [Caerostris extrusa]
MKLESPFVVKMNLCIHLCLLYVYLPRRPKQKTWHAEVNRKLSSVLFSFPSIAPSRVKFTTFCNTLTHGTWGEMDDSLAFHLATPSSRASSSQFFNHGHYHGN